MPPAPTARLRFREMADADLDHLAGLLADPVVMRFYPAPRTRAEAAAWIAGNRRRYAQDGHGLWTVSYTHLTLPTIHVECRSRWSPYH